MITWMLLCITFLLPTIQDTLPDTISLQTQNLINVTTKETATNTLTITTHSSDRKSKIESNTEPIKETSTLANVENVAVNKKQYSHIKQVKANSNDANLKNKPTNKKRSTHVETANAKSTSSKSSEKKSTNQNDESIHKKSTDSTEIKQQSTDKNAVDSKESANSETDNIVDEIKIRFDIFYLIEYKSIDRNIFDKYITPHDAPECIPSVYKLWFHDCCMSQFAINYLYSLGFNHVKEMYFNKWRTGIHNDDKTMTNDNITRIGCLGLNIQQKHYKPAQIFISLGHKTTSYVTIMSYCNKYKIKKYCRQFLPKTYDLQISSQRIKFFRRLSCDNNPNNEWLLKSDAHGGNGIVFIKNSNYLRNYFLEPWEQNISSPDCIIDDNYNFNISKHVNISEGLVHEMVAQKLITNAARINKCTFHIRSYIVVANYENPSIVLYGGSVILRSTNPSELRSNRHQSEHFENPDDDLSWHLNMQQFADYYGDAMDVENVVEQVINISRVVFLSVMKDVEMSVTGKHVQHYGQTCLDFILTEYFEVKFLDFNIPCGTAHVPHCFDEIEDSMGKKAVMKDIWQCTNAKRIMEEMVNIEIEIAIKKQNGETLDKLDSVKTFDVILWE